MKRVVCIVMTWILLLVSAGCSSLVQESQPSATQSQQASGQHSSEPSAESAGNVIVFNDPVLEKRVREQMKKPQGDVTIGEAEAVEVLNLKNEQNKSEESIRDISALKYFKNLKVLDISLNNISDISPVAVMKKLEAFYSMNGNSSITDFSPLAGLTAMLDLSILHGENINDSNIGFIKDMTLMEMIWISDAPDLTDISIVASFKNLRRLNVNNTGVSDMSPVKGLVTLMEMDLSGSKISDVSPLKDLTNLKKLLLEGCPIKEYSPLKDIYPHLEEKDFKLE